MLYLCLRYNIFFYIEFGDLVRAIFFRHHLLHRLLSLQKFSEFHLRLPKHHNHPLTLVLPDLSSNPAPLRNPLQLHHSTAATTTLIVDARVYLVVLIRSQSFNDNISLPPPTFRLLYVRRGLHVEHGVGTAAVLVEGTHLQIHKILQRGRVLVFVRGLKEEALSRRVVVHGSWEVQKVVVAVQGGRFYERLKVVVWDYGALVCFKVEEGGGVVKGPWRFHWRLEL